MTDAPDAELLQQFARNDSEAAFAEIVRRHLALVHSVALRHTADAQHAQDITQAVFIILARKAASLGRKTVLSGWLYHTARLTAANFQRSEARRIRREQETFMQSTLDETPSDVVWSEIAPLLDEAMSRLGRTDRDAIVLRYFENKNLREVGAALGLRERAAQKRVARSLEKLRAFLARRGVVSTTAIVAGAISANSVQAAPASAVLAKSVTTVAIAKGAAASASTLTLINGALKIMAWTKAKTTIVVGVGLLLTAGTATLTVNQLRPSSLEDRIAWTTDRQTLEKQPPVALVRFTKNIMTSSDGKSIPLGGSAMSAITPSGKMAALNTDLGYLLRFAYDNARVDRQLIWMGEQPTNHFDAIYTLAPDAHGQMQQAIQHLTGWSARLEKKEETVLALKTKNPNAPGLKPSGQDRAIGRRGGPSGGSEQGVSMAILARLLSHELQAPVVDQTGLAGRFDVQLDLDSMKSLEEKKQIVLDQLGLDLVPTAEKQVSEVLVAEKAK